MPRKRTRDEMEASEPPAQQAQDIPLITKIRNMWEFASVMQFIATFGHAVRIDDNFDIEVCHFSLPAPAYLALCSVFTFMHKILIARDRTLRKNV
jgi:hypothetical protein